jgi:acetyltransferase-like isoleucine patch superfamily enzyme
MNNSIISKKADIGKNVTIGSFVKIYDNVTIGDNTIIEDHCVLGLPNKHSNGNLVIGNNGHIRSHSILYEGSIFGENFYTGHHCLIRENNKAGKNLQIGSYAELEGSIDIGDYSRLHSKVQISKKVKIGSFCYLFPRVQTSDDPLPPSHIARPPEIGDLSVIAINTLILPNTKIRKNSFIGASSVVSGEFVANSFIAGSPAKRISDISKLRLPEYGLKHPWYNHFRDAFPEESQELLTKIIDSI